jgi:hypothetical protein
MSDDAHTEPDDATLAEDEREATQAHVADRAATAEEAEAADRSRDEFASDAPAVAENEESMAKRGAEIKGEGEVK